MFFRLQGTIESTMGWVGRWGLLLGMVLSACANTPVPPIQRFVYHAQKMERPLAEKIVMGNADLLEQLHQTNLKYGQDIRPIAARAQHPLVEQVRSMVAGLPEGLRALANRHVVAIYLVEQDWGTGTTEAVQDAQGRWRLAYIALNLSALERSANAWGSWKERSAFRSAPGHSLRMVLEPPEEDTVESAIRFIFLHELGHALGLALEAHGFWDNPGLPVRTRESPFLNISWQPAGEKMIPREQAHHLRFSELGFYRFEQASLSLAEAETLYRALTRNAFPSLYGATHGYEDFAETFAIYVHTQLLGKPYRVEVSPGKGPPYVYRSCIANGTCPRKVAALRRIVGL